MIQTEWQKQTERAESPPQSGTDLELLQKGRPPKDGALLEEISAGMNSLLDFLRKHYLQDYIPQGGSKIKFVTGRPGSGKTHFSRMLLREAEKQGFLTVRFSAETVWLHDFRTVYLEILRQCGIETVLSNCAEVVIQTLGYDSAQFREGQRFMDYLAERGEGDHLVKSEILNALRNLFTRNPRMDNCFAACCSLLTGGLLGYPALEAGNRNLLLSFLNGEKGVKPSHLRALGVSPTAVTRFNARHLLRSLAELVRIAGFQGLVIHIDDMEKLLDRSMGSAIRYTRMRREDSYESIRQLIDDIDSMRYVLFLLSFDRKLIDDEAFGFKSYQALWLRIQNEVVSNRFNRFADIIDLDRYADECYDEPLLCAMAERLRLAFERLGAPGSGHPMEMENARNIMRQANFSGLGLPFMVNRAVVESIWDGTAIRTAEGGANNNGTYI